MVSEVVGDDTSSVRGIVCIGCFTRISMVSRKCPCETNPTLRVQARFTCQMCRTPSSSSTWLLGMDNITSSTSLTTSAEERRHWLRQRVVGCTLAHLEDVLHDFGTGTSINKRTRHIVSAPMGMDVGCSDNLVACPHQHGAAMQEPSMTGLRLKLSRTYCSDAPHKRTDQIVAKPYRVSAVTHWQCSRS